MVKDIGDVWVEAVSKHGLEGRTHPSLTKHPVSFIPFLHSFHITTASWNRQRASVVADTDRYVIVYVPIIKY